MKLSFFPLVAIFTALVPEWGFAVGPLEVFQGLVAGNGEAGIKDGAFYEALFTKPMGLAISPDGSMLYVADSGNHLIRAVSLSEQNKVLTLAGTGKPGNTDGPFPQASFNLPSALALLPNNRLAVFDQGGSAIRVLDLNSKSVSVLAGDGRRAVQDGPGLQASLYDVWNMAYFPPDNCLYFSQPDQGLLRRVALGDGKVETVLAGDARAPMPGALCAVQNDLYVANAGVTGTVLRFKADPNAAQGEKPLDAFTVEDVGQGRSIKALAGLDDFLYGMQADPDMPVQQLLPKLLPVTLISCWGELYSKAIPVWPFFDSANLALGFIADPLSKQRFFLSDINRNRIASFRDTKQDLLLSKEFNSSGLMDMEYPFQKPPHTFRILLVGRSYIYFTLARLPAPVHETTNRMESLPKRMELSLNVLASLDDSPQRFEILNCGKIMKQSLYLWPMHLVPDLVKKYDIDLVLLVMDTGTYVTDYFEFPISPDGLPVYQFDPEYALKPVGERVPPGVPKKFYDLCRKKNLIHITSKTGFFFDDIDVMLRDPEITDCLLEMLGKPLDTLNRRIRASSPSPDRPRRLKLCLLPSPSHKTGEIHQLDFWRRLSRKSGFEMMDLFGIFTAHRSALFPFSELGGMDHFDTNGTLWLSEVLIHELIKNKDLPWAPSRPPTSPP